MAVSLTQTVVATVDSGDTITLPSWTPVADDWVMIFLALRTVPSDTLLLEVSGCNFRGGLSHANDQIPNSGGLLVVAQFPLHAPITGALTVTLTKRVTNTVTTSLGNTKGVSVIACRFAGYTLGNQYGYLQSATSDDATVSGTIPRAADIFMTAVAHRTSTLTVPGGQTAVTINQEAGAVAGTKIRLSVFRGPAQGLGAFTVGGLNDLSGSEDWALRGTAFLAAGTTSTVVVTDEGSVTLPDTSTVVNVSPILTPSSTVTPMEICFDDSGVYLPILEDVGVACP